MPSMPIENEKLVVELLNCLVQSSCIKINGTNFITPPLKRKHVASDNSPTPPSKCYVKKANPIQEPHNVDAKVLFPEVQASHVAVGLSKTTKRAIHKAQNDDDVVFLKEVNLNDRLNETNKTSDTLYNQNNVLETKVEGPTTVRNVQSPSMSFVNEDKCNLDAGCVAIPESTRFPVTPREKLVFNALCSLAKSKHARSTIVDIGGCIVKYVSLGESMAIGNEVCTYVVNAMCRKFFTDERPTVSKKHYFFSSKAEVFLGESTDYSSAKRSFNGAASVVPLTLCDSKESFLRAWSLFFGPTTRFSEFRTAYPHVPKQENESKNLYA